MRGVSILQNRIGVGGRSVVIAEFIRLCNDAGVVPHVYCCSQAEDEEAFRAEHGLSLRYVLHRLPGFRGRGWSAYETPLLNLIAARSMRLYDLVFNSGRCPYFLPKGPVYIHYVHFPLEATLTHEEHLRTAIGRLYTAPLRFLYAGRARGVKTGVFFANSAYTAAVLREVYKNLCSSQVRVVYPPCRVSVKLPFKERDLDIVSLGAFVSDKRQLEQVGVAACMRNRGFNIVGTVKSARYYRICEAEAAKRQLRNVVFHPNAPRAVVEDLLVRAKVFLHSKRGEHFGVSTVEAIAHGCLPVVHDSGGSREVVPIRELRFNTSREAEERIERLLRLTASEREKLLGMMREHIRRFGVDQFRSALVPFLEML